MLPILPIVYKRRESLIGAYYVYWIRTTGGYHGRDEMKHLFSPLEIKILQEIHTLVKSFSVTRRVHQWKVTFPPPQYALLNINKHVALYSLRFKTPKAPQSIHWTNMKTWQLTAKRILFNDNRLCLFFHYLSYLPFTHHKWLTLRPIKAFAYLSYCIEAEWNTLI